MPIPTRRTLVVAIVSGALGFRVGMVNFPDWQVAVETAQVTAGLVSYPLDNPYYIYHVKLWTLMHQLLALLLRAGVEEIRLSLIVSGVVGMLSFQALALSVYAIGREPVLAVAAALVVFFSGATEFGVTYPVLLLGSSHTYGMVGLALVVIVAALFGTGALRTGALLLGVAPAVHPALGAWLWLIVGLSVLWDALGRRRGAVPSRNASPGDDRPRGLHYYFVAGCAITAVSLAVQMISMPPLPTADSAAARQYSVKFFEFWDGHRQPVDLAHAGVWLNLGALSMALLWLTAFRSDLSRSRAFLLRFVAVSAAVSLVFALVSWIPPASLPTLLMVLMPTRLLNINAMLFAPLVFGLLIMFRHTTWASVLMPLTATALLLGNRSLMWREVAETQSLWVHRLGPVFRSDTLVLLGMAAMAIAAAVAAGRQLHLRPFQPRGGRVVSRAAVVATVGLAVWSATLTWPLRRPTHLMFQDRTNSPMFIVAAATPGMLLTGGNLFLVQIRTRRPVLINGGALDTLSYAAESAVGMAGILRDVYGIDLLNPPAEAWARGTVPNEANQTAWEGYTRDVWRDIGRRYGVTQVLAYSHWTIDLPVAARDRCCVLYDVPD